MGIKKRREIAEHILNDYMSETGNDLRHTKASLMQRSDWLLEKLLDRLEGEGNNNASTESKCDKHIVSGSYLAKFVDPNKEYPANYTVKQDGMKVRKPQMLIGADLTEPQIVELFSKQLL